MSFFQILETLLIGPLKLVFELIFGIANKIVGHPGVAIIFLSLAMNILVLPLYRRADAMQEEARDIDLKLSKGVAHIKKTFTGDERMMILQTYYRQNNYKPTQALNGSVSLLLEIPFFMAAYQFLSHLDILDDISLGPIKDLGAPDGLIVIGALSINLLPILMTLINVISSYIYLKGFPLKTKIQLYGMALFFLVFLYTSPSCLVFYWTLNNLFSLVKTIFYKLKNPQKKLVILTAIFGLCFFVWSVLYKQEFRHGRLCLIAIGACLELPLIVTLVKKKISFKIKVKEAKPSRKLFVLACLLLTVFIGLFIPAQFIASSPQEFIDVGYVYNPIWYIVSALCFSAGTFLVWMGVFYWLASPNYKVLFERIAWMLCGTALVNYMFFGTKLGTLSATLQYEGGLKFSTLEKVINTFVIIALAIVLFIVICKFKRVTATLLATVIIAVCGMSTVNIVKAKKSIDNVTANNDMASFNLSTTGQNVVVIMLDRAMGEYIPYLFAERPELEEKFAGFTYYSNVISFGGSTNFASPALLGGYEYTPVELNKRNDEKLVDKQNEALKVMPTVFANNGYEVTVCDPVYAGYQWIPDLSIYDDNPNINAYITKGKYSDIERKKVTVENRKRNFFCFSMMKSMPLLAQSSLYNSGRYNQLGYKNASNQTLFSLSTSKGFKSSFMDSYDVLTNMSNITQITDKNVNTFLFLSNDATHESMLLQEPDYTPALYVDNTEYDAAHTDRFNVNGRELEVANKDQIRHYHINMAALIQLGNWFDYLREKGVYDNTRIILVADHGYYLSHLDELVMDDGTDKLKDVEHYYPLLMVKDFNSTEYSESTEFMTKADVPTLAMKDIIENPVNPFTKKPINNSEKTAHDQFVIMSYDWKTSKNNGNTFMPARWAKVSGYNEGGIWNKNNWTFYDDEIVLDKHFLP